MSTFVQSKYRRRSGANRDENRGRPCNLESYDRACRRAQPQCNEVNRAIDALTDKIKAHYKRINLSLGFVTAELVKNAVKGIGQKPLTLLALFREHNEEFRKRVGIDRTKGDLRELCAFVQSPA